MHVHTNLNTESEYRHRYVSTNGALFLPSTDCVTLSWTLLPRPYHTSPLFYTLPLVTFSMYCNTVLKHFKTP